MPSRTGTKKARRACAGPCLSWSGQRDSNPRMTAWEAVALPLGDARMPDDSNTASVRRESTRREKGALGGKAQCRAIRLNWTFPAFNDQSGAAGMKRLWMCTGTGTKSAAHGPTANVYRRSITTTKFAPSRSCSVRILSAGIPILVRSPPYAPSTNAKGRSR